MDARTTVLFLWTQIKLLLFVYRETVRHFANQERLWKSVNTSRNRSLVPFFKPFCIWRVLCRISVTYCKPLITVLSCFHCTLTDTELAKFCLAYTQKPVACHSSDRCRDSHVPRIVLSAPCGIAARYLRITPPEVTAVRWQMLWLLTTWGNPFVLLVKPWKHRFKTNLWQRTTPHDSSKLYIWSPFSA